MVTKRFCNRLNIHMIFNQNKKLAEALDQALEMKKNGRTIAEIIKLYPEFSAELKSLLSTAEAVETGQENVQPSKAVLQEILARLERVTEKADARYSFTEKDEGFSIKNVLLNFNQAIMSKKVYVGAAIGVFLLAIIVGVGWYGLPGGQKDDALLSLQKSGEQADAEIDYLASLAVDPFVDLDGDLQKIIDSSGSDAEKSSAEPADVDSGMKKLEADLDDFQKNLSELDSLGEGTSLSGVEDTLSTIDQSY